MEYPSLCLKNNKRILVVEGLSHVDFAELGTYFNHWALKLTRALSKKGDAIEHTILEDRSRLTSILVSSKLRCSRDAPCSNCISRGIQCDLEVKVVQPPIVTTVASETSRYELLERIRKLEELVELQRSQQYAPNVGSTSGQTESSGTRTPAEQVTISNVSAKIEHLDNDVAYLASIYNGTYVSEKTGPKRIVFRICPVQQIMEAQPYLDQNTYTGARCDPQRCIWLPQYPEAKILLQKFLEDMDHIHHVVHTPSVRKILDDVYSCLGGQSKVQPGSILLILAIIASATHGWVQSDCDRGLFCSRAEVNAQSSFWIKAFEDVLDIAQRICPISVEGIQGISIAAFVLVSMEGFSRRCKVLFNSVFPLARELGLHLIDHPANAKTAQTVEAEIGRRVWWHTVSTDWLAPARFYGATQGCYTCHPRHMLTNRPMNANDEELVDGMCNVEKPHSSPTTMSYTLLRLRLAEISRHMVDRSPPSSANFGPPNHDIVMDIDTEMQMLLNDVPSFFSLSRAELVITYNMSAARAADIEYQGFMFRSLFWAQRCTLHFPYFSRGFFEQDYISSKDMCLLSARQVIAAESKMGGIGISATRFKFLGLLVSTFVASIIILMELCHNKASSQNEQHRAEITDAIRILEDARHESDTAGKFLDSLMQVMRKHKIVPGEDTQQQSALSPPVHGNQQLLLGSFGTNHQSVPSAEHFEGSDLILPILDTSNTDMTDPIFVNEEDMSSYLRGLAQSFEHGMDTANFDWNDVFSGIDPSIV